MNERRDLRGVGGRGGSTGLNDALGLAAVLIVLPCVATAETPTLWNCLGEARIQRRATDCVAAAMSDGNQVSLHVWTYERCAKVCVSGTRNRWVETAYGEVVVVASDYPQYLVLRPGSRFTDVATVGHDTLIREAAVPCLEGSGDHSIASGRLQLA